MQLKIRIVDAKFLQFTYEGHILVLVPTGGDLLRKSIGVIPLIICFEKTSDQ